MSTRYPFPDIQNLPDDLRAKILEVQEKAGFVPNVFLALARRPAEWRASARKTLGTKPAFSCTSRILLRKSSGRFWMSGKG